MAVFPNHINRSINKYEKKAAEANYAEKKLVNTFITSVTKEELIRILRIVKFKGYKEHQEMAKAIEERVITGQLTGDDIVLIRVIAEANIKYIEGEGGRNTY